VPALDLHSLDQHQVTDSDVTAAGPAHLLLFSAPDSVYVLSGELQTPRSFVQPEDLLQQATLADLSAGQPVHLRSHSRLHTSILYLLSSGQISTVAAAMCLLTILCSCLQQSAGLAQLTVPEGCLYCRAWLCPCCIRCLSQLSVRPCASAAPLCLPAAWWDQPSLAG
jgi:hypothetical protein